MPIDRETMGTQVVEPPVLAPVKVETPATPAQSVSGASPTPPTTPAPVVVDWEKKYNEERTQREQAERKAEDERNTRATIEARAKEAQPVKLDASVSAEIAEALKEASYDPEKAAGRITAMLEKSNDATAKRALEQALTQVPAALEQNAFIQKTYAENDDLIKAGAEPMIAARAQALMAGGKSLNESVTIAIKEYRDSIAPFKAPPTPVPPPRGAVSDAGAGTMPSPAPSGATAPVLSELDEQKAEIQERRDRAAGIARHPK